jgi:hypothetical protein
VIEDLARYVGLEVEEQDGPSFARSAGLPLAQKRTSRNKAPVRVGPTEVFKGPYPAHSLKLLNNLRYPYLIHLLEEALELPGECRGVYRWQRLLCTGSGAGRLYCLAGANVGCPARMQVRHASTRIDTSFDVVERGTLVRRVSELEKVKRLGRYERSPDLDRRLAVASLQHLYLRHLFNVGDSGTHNILVREDYPASGRLVAGIDCDEHRRPGQGRTAFACLFKQDQPYLHAVYDDDLSRIRRIAGLAPPVERAIDAINALCRRWEGALPAPLRPRAGEAAVRAEDVLARNARLLALLPPGRP